MTFLIGLGLALMASLGIILVFLGLRGSKPPPLGRIYSDLTDARSSNQESYKIGLQENFSRTASKITKRLPKKKASQETFIYRSLDRLIASIRESYVHGEKSKWLATIGRAPSDHARIKLQAAAGSAVFFGILIFLIVASGIVNINYAIIVIIGLIGGLIGYWVPDNIIKTEALKRRREFDEAMYIWIDLTTQFLSTGEDGTAAMIKASTLSTIWPFKLINSALSYSQLRARPAYEGLRELSQDLGFDSLKGLVEAMELSSEYGTELSEVIRSFVQSFRTQAVIDAEARVEASAEQSALPLGLVVVAFLILLAYPGIQGVLNTGLSDFGGGSSEIADFTNN